jgi:hypothetical protein
LATPPSASLFAGCAGTPRYTTSLDQDVTPIGQVRFTRPVWHRITPVSSTDARRRAGTGTTMNDFTAAHPTLPFGTRVKVTNFSNNQSVVVRVNDRGPHKKSRIIDVSFAAAKKIGLIASGTARVSLEVKW